MLNDARTTKYNYITMLACSIQRLSSRGWKRNNLNVIIHYSFTFFGRYSLFISNFFPIIHYSFTIAKGIECVQNTIARSPLFCLVQTSDGSGDGDGSRDGRILTF